MRVRRLLRRGLLWTVRRDRGLVTYEARSREGLVVGRMVSRWIAPQDRRIERRFALEHILTELGRGRPVSTRLLDDAEAGCMLTTDAAGHNLRLRRTGETAIAQLDPHGPPAKCGDLLEFTPAAKSAPTPIARLAQAVLSDPLRAWGGYRRGGG